ncbi:MAG: phosphoglycerate mutase family protein [Gammaproteobacteria bacterium]|nr:phosphoglycerate mutase family protein [Gammaproteobacteria bacterium]
MAKKRTTVSLIRHGQASFGQKNYDQLSPLGMQQLEHVGAHLAQREEQIDVILRGNLARHEQSVDALLRGYGSSAGSSPDVVEVPEWNEFDHRAVMHAYAQDHAELRAWLANPKPIDTGSRAETQQVMQIFREAVVRWQSGQHDADYAESWPQFLARVDQAWQTTQESIAMHQNVFVLTSGGPISLSVMASLQLPAESLISLNKRLVNGGFTRFLVASEQSSRELLSLNEQQHFGGKFQHLLTYI